MPRATLGHLSPLKNKLGWYIWIDATCVAGPFDTEAEAVASLEPEARKAWTWELGGPGGKAYFLSLPFEAFSIDYHGVP